MKKIVVIGDVGVDHYVRQNIIKPGGIAFNFAYNLSILGEKNISVISAVGNDLNGEKMIKIIKNLGIKPSYIKVKKGITPIQKIELEDGERKFVGYNSGVLSDWGLHDDDVAFLLKQDVLFVPLSDGMEVVFDIVKRLVGPIKVVDFSKDYEFADLDKRENMLTKNARYFDILFVGGDKKEEKLVKQLSSKYPEKVFVLTLGSLGSIGFISGKKVIQPAKITENIVDTTGCGDAFQAAFTSTYIDTGDLAKSLLLASNHASKIINYLGSSDIELI